MPERFALYFAPPTTHPLWISAARWLGRDPAEPSFREAAEIEGIDTRRRLEISESARRYGFHATLKAPMALAAGTTRAELEAALAAFGAAMRPVAIGRLKVATIDGFIALIPEHQTEALTDFAAEVVAQFDRFRAPLASGDRETRIRVGHLTPPQVAFLDLYGYPYVMDEFRFHMTLTDRLADPELSAVKAIAEEWFAPVLRESYWLDRIALFFEPSPGVPFVRLDGFVLGEKMTADA